MWIVDTALKSRADQNRPIRVGIIGAGFMSQGLTNQITHSTPGMRVAAISNRRAARAIDAYRFAGFDEVAVAGTQARLDSEIERGNPVVTDDAKLIASSGLI